MSGPAPQGGMSFEVRLDGLPSVRRLAERLETLGGPGRDEFIGGLIRLFERYREQLKAGSPYRTGRLRRSWYADRVSDAYRIYNTARAKPSRKQLMGAPYPYFVNYGHRIVRNGVQIGYYKGQMFMERELMKAHPVFLAMARSYIKRWLNGGG